MCEKLCIPAEGKAQLLLERNAAANDALTAAEARVPKQVPAGDIALKLKRSAAKPKPLVTLDVAAPEGEPVEVFVEGPGKDGPCPSRSPRKARRKGIGNSASNSTAFRPGPTRWANMI